MNRKLLAIAGLALAGLATDAAAQTALQPGTIVGTFQAALQLQTSIGTLYTVPGDRNARITDAIVLNMGDNACLIALIPGNGAFFWVYPAAQSTTVIPLNSGLGLTAGTVVTAYASTCVNNQILLTVRGFNFTIP